MVALAAMMSIFTHQRRKNSFPQTPICNTQTIGWPKPNQRFQDRATGQNEIGPFAADARLGDPLIVGLRDEVIADTDDMIDIGDDIKYPNSPFKKSIFHFNERLLFF